MIGVGDLEIDLVFKRTNDKEEDSSIAKELSELKNRFSGQISFLDKGFLNVSLETGASIDLSHADLLQWDSNDEMLSFIKCSADMPDSEIGWADGDEWKENEVISEFTNELTKILGDQGEIYISWEVWDEDNVYESFSVEHTYNPDGVSPSTRVFVDLYD